jgi:hypothetical protein
MSVLIIQLLARMLQLGKNEIYQLGVSYGEMLRDTDDDLDPKDLDYEVQQLGEQIGTAPVVGKLLGSDEFLDGVAQGYYGPEIQESAPFKNG